MATGWVNQGKRYGQRAATSRPMAHKVTDARSRRRVARAVKQKQRKAGR